MPVTNLTLRNRCRPFLLKVMVFNPESGYKFEVTIQLVCNDNNEKVWKIIFNLYKKIDDELVQIVGVEFQSGSVDEDKAIEEASTNGLNLEQSRKFRNVVYPPVKGLEDGHEPSEEEKERIDSAMREAVLAK